MELVTSQMTAASQYMAAVRDVLDVIAAQEAAQVQAAAAAVVLALQADRMIYIFGTGHSHMLAEEGHYRAGGLAPVCPVLFSALMLHEGAVASTQLERTSGLAPALLLRYNVQPGEARDTVSNFRRGLCDTLFRPHDASLNLKDSCQVRPNGAPVVVPCRTRAQTTHLTATVTAMRGSGALFRHESVRRLTKQEGDIGKQRRLISLTTKR